MKTKTNLSTSSSDEQKDVKDFKELGMIEPIIKAINEQGIVKPTQIQEMSIPIILSGKDIIAGSKTGSGKTLAFGTAIIQNITKGKGIQAIVLTPTRELCVQVTESLSMFSKYIGLRVTPIYGGVSINPQMNQLKRTDVVVGTPGRVLDHLQRGTLNLSNVKVAVLDEADRMLDMGFIEDVERILSQCQEERQTLLYSATISSEIYGLSKKYMNNPEKMQVESNVDPKLLKQVYYQVPQNLKFSLLVHLLKGETTGLCMVFCNTQRITDFISKNLVKNGIHAIAIHGGLTQAKRAKTMETFQSGRAFVLVCTDVAARGLHVENVSHVYNYDIPRESKQYIHRIGRTARAGKDGIAINLLTERDYDNFNFVLRDNNLNIPRVETPDVERIILPSMHKNRDRGFRNNFRRPRR
jgi:ATP-dependent RNA helicase DeaD